MKIQELRQLTPKKLVAELSKARRELAATRFHVKTGQNQNTAEVKKLRNVIARILTLLSAQKHEAQTPEQS